MAEPAPAPSAGDRLADAVDTITVGGLIGLSADDMIDRLVTHLRDGGMPVARLHVSLTQLHPQFESFSRTWSAAGGLERVEHEWGSRFAPSFQASPIHALLSEQIPALSGRAAEDIDALMGAWTRYRLAAGEGLDRFPILREFAEAGLTDYVLLATPYLDGAVPEPGTVVTDRGVIISWASDAPGGFDAADVTLIRRLQKPFALALRSAMQRHVGSVLLSTYLGRDAGNRVLTGLVRRGDVTRLQATVLLADLRGFTALAARLPADALVRTLDAYLEAMAEPVAEHGGEVLKFLGDGLLAVFRQEGAAGADAGYQAACAARDRVAALNRSREAAGDPILGLDQAIHAGEVLYGNVGATERLDFTVIGPAVNEVSRMEQLCGRDVAGDLLVSEQVYRLLPATAGLREAGAFALRDVDGDRALWIG